MRSKIFFLFFRFLMVAVQPLLASCISYVYPHGQWVEPVDLAIHATSLDGIPIKVICSDADGGNITEGEGCVFIKKIVANMGAVVEDMPEKEDSDTESPIQSATKKNNRPGNSRDLPRNQIRFWNVWLVAGPHDCQRVPISLFGRSRFIGKAHCNRSKGKSKPIVATNGAPEKIFRYWSSILDALRNWEASFSLSVSSPAVRKFRKIY